MEKYRDVWCTYLRFIILYLNNILYALKFWIKYIQDDPRRFYNFTFTSHLKMSNFHPVQYGFNKIATVTDYYYYIDIVL